MSGSQNSCEILRLRFDEGKGSAVRDSSGRLPDAAVQYRYLNAAFTENMDPQWRKTGIGGGSLLFDGSSTAVVYPAGQPALAGSRLTISAWIAPRAFEWDDPYAADRGEAHITAVLSQYSREGKSGVLLGYHRFGRLCFQAGTGSSWFVLWADTARLKRLAWNHVAAVFDGENGRMLLYRNGEPAGEMRIPAGSAIAPAVGESLMIGKNSRAESIPHGTFNMFCGLMCDLRVEQTALDGAEIRRRAAADRPEIPYEEIGPENILRGDVHKTQFHGGPYQHWMNEPHAPVYYNGVYHLFFQSNSIGPYWRGISWGHLVSRDTVRWRPVRDAIVPEEGSVTPDGVWSGGAALDVNGVPVLFFTAANYRFTEAGLISNQNIGAAYPADLSDPELTEWVLLKELAVAQKPGQGRPGEYRDSHVWREGDTWYMVVCSGSADSPGATALLYFTDELEVVPGRGIRMNWQYRGPVYEMENQPPVYGTSWELPILIPLVNREGTKTRHAFFFMPAPADKADNKVYYFVGDFDRETGRFTPDDAYHGCPRLLDYGENVFTGPSVLQDPATGRMCVFSIMQDQRDGEAEGKAGWAHCAGLTRNIRLSDDGLDVRVSPDPRLESLEGEELLRLAGADMEEANRALSAVSADLFHLKADLRPRDGGCFGIAVRTGGKTDRTVFTYDTDRHMLSARTANPGYYAGRRHTEGPLELDNGVLHADIYVDRSLAEGFFNDDKAVSIRSYADRQSQGIFLFSDSSLSVENLRISRMRSIYETAEEQAKAPDTEREPEA